LFRRFLRENAGTKLKNSTSGKDAFGRQRKKMKEPSPLVPQGSFEAQAKRKSHVRIAVFSILAIHVVVLGGLLILGCKRDDNKDAKNEMPTNDVPAFATNDVVTATNPPPLPTNALVSVPPVPTNQPNTIVNEPPGAVIEHTIVKGDNFATLATKYGVSAKAIQDANPNLIPTKLKIGDKVKIPPKAAVSARAAVPANGGDTYTVKSGDTLSKIAKDHHTSVPELQKLNSLSTTQIKVGQKLKVPPSAAATPTGGTTPPPAQ
jgi:LysM repeat protein